MYFHNILTKKRTSILGVVAALYLSASPMALGDIVVTGTVSPFMPIGMTNWVDDDFLIGGAGSDTEVYVLSPSVIQANETFQMLDITGFDNSVLVSGSGARLQAKFLDLNGSRNKINVYDDGILLVTENLNSQGFVSIEDAVFDVWGDAYFNGPGARLELKRGAVAYVHGDWHIGAGSALISHTQMNLGVGVNGGVFWLAGGDVQLDKAELNSNHFTAYPAIAAGTASSVIMRNGSLWHNKGDMDIGANGPVSFQLTDSEIVNEGVIEFFGLEGNHEISLNNSALTASDLMANNDEDFKLVIQNGSEVKLTGDLVFNAGGVNTLQISAGSLYGDRFEFSGDGNFGVLLDSVMNFDSGIVGGAGAVNVGAIYPNGVMSFTNDFILGSEGDTTLHVGASATLKAANIEMAQDAGSKSHLVIWGTTSGGGVLGDIDTPVIQFGQGDALITFDHGVLAKARTAQGYLFRPDIVGAGTLEQLRGDTTVTGDYTGFTGSMDVLGGRLFVSHDAVLGANTDFLVKNRAELDFDGGAQRVGNIVNDGGHINFGHGLDAVITVDNYTASGLASMAMESGFVDRPGLTDKLVVLGDTSGTTYLRVRDIEREGAEGDDGIEIIEVQGQSLGNFILMGDYQLPDGQQAVYHGSYSYTLNKGANTARAFGDNSWYLRRVTPASGGGGGGGAIYQPATSVYEAYPQALLELGRMAQLDERQGSKQFISGAAAGDEFEADRGFEFWTSVVGHHIKVDSKKSITDTKYKQNSGQIKVGVDALVHESEAGRLVAGGSVHYVHGNTETQAGTYYGDGRIKTNGYGVSPTLTWYGNNGFYVDGQAMLTFYKSDLKSNKIAGQLVNDNKSTAYALSGEVGQRFRLGNGWGASVQGQLVYNEVDFDNFKDHLDAAYIKHKDGQSLRGRIGGALDYTSYTQDGFANIYGGLSVYNQFLKTTKIGVYDSNGLDPVYFKGAKERAWIGANLGATHSWRGDGMGIYGEVGASTPFSGFGDSYTLRGSAGLKFKF